MTLPSTIHNKVGEEVAGEVDRLLSSVDPAPFSAPAFSVLKGRITQYISDLVQESAAVARRDRADSISAKHVEIACEHIAIRSRNQVYKFAGNIGGIALGTCVSTLVAMALVGQYPLSGIVISSVSGVVGGFLLALNLIKG